MDEITFQVTNAGRLGVHLLLLANWGGSLEQLESMVEIQKALRLDLDYQAVQIGADNRISWPAHLANGHTSDVTLRVSDARFLLKFFPQAPTPAQLGPAKVALLRTLRELLPVEAPPA